jgi:hypothetical protein
MIRESGVIEHLVGFHPAIWRADPSLPRIDPFERERPGDFPEEDQIIGDPDRLVRQGYREKPPGFLLAQSRNVERANSIISILNKFGIDTPACTSTLSTISGKRSALETALTNKDKDALKTVNTDLKTLWQQFRTEMRDAIRDHYGRKAAGNSAATATPDLAAATV